MGLYSQIVALNAAQKGETVSYGGTWKAKKDSIIGIVPIGYADGYSRSLSNKGYMGVLGQKAPVVGSVTMDYTMIDLTDIVQAGKNILGERVTIFEGNGVHSVKILADLAGTIPYELITCIGRRVPRKYIK
jgi:alanine racemase